MENAQCSASLLRNQNGNIHAVIALIAVITGSLIYFMTANDMVNKEIRKLSGTQNTAYLKSDLIDTLKKTLSQGPIPGCDTTIGNEIKDKFQDFLKSNDESRFEISLTQGAENYGDFLAANKDKMSCFFHPARYGNTTEFRLFKLKIERSASPNFINLSNYLIAEATIQTRYENQTQVHKYQLRYRVDALNMSHFGFIFTPIDDVSPLVETDEGGFVEFSGFTLVDQPDREKDFVLSRLTNYKSITFNSPVYLLAPELSQDTTSINFLLKQNLRTYLKEGIYFDFFDKRNSQPVPWKSGTGKFKDLFNYDMIASGRYPLPKVDSGESAHSTSGAGITHLYSNDKFNDPIPGGIESINRSTNGIYTLMSGDKAKLTTSCASADPSSGVYNLLIFNNLTEDFTIDFSGNTSIDSPPVFCGLIAARNLTIILNDTDVDDATKADIVRHFVIGKFIIKGKIIVKNKGRLTFTDIKDLTQETISPYEVIDDYMNVQVQFYNQKFYSSQNFNLPFFKTNSIYSESDMINGENRFWVPRDTKEFFVTDCSGKKCRTSPIGTPATDKEILEKHGSNLFYEVFHVE